MKVSEREPERGHPEHVAHASPRWTGENVAAPALSTPDADELKTQARTASARSLAGLLARIRQRGVLRVAEDIAMRGLNRAIFLKVMHGMKLETVNPIYTTAPERYQGAFLDYAQLREFGRSPEYQFPPDFLENAFAKGDRCYGFLTTDGVLAAYQWYSTKPTWYFAPTKVSGWNGVVVNFANEYIYMYKGFTHPSHRGRRLYPTGVSTVLSSYQAQGYKGIVSIVESNNFASLQACYRMGYEDFGLIYLTVLFGKCLIHADPACNALGFRLTATKSLRADSCP